jgi:hypothetical protein
MVNRNVIIFLATLASFAIGCTPPPPPPPSSGSVGVYSADDYNAFKARYLNANPDARVGRVMAVLTNEHRLSIGDIPTKDFSPGDVLTILDGTGNVLADGTVADLDADTLDVNYTLSTSGTFREPRAGDIAVRALPPSRN